MTDIKRIKVFNPCEEGLNYHSDWIGKSVDNINDADVVLFTGTRSLSSKFNIESKNNDDSLYSDSNYKQDLSDFSYMMQAINLKKPIVGVNKGMLMLHSLTSTPLVTYMQHPIIHNIEFLNGKLTCLVNSSHSQMAVVEEISEEYKLIAFSRDISPFYMNHKMDNYAGLLRDTQQRIIEPEIIYYDTLNAIGFQFDVYNLKGTSLARYISRKLIELLISKEMSQFIDLEVPIEDLIKYNFKIENYKSEKDTEEYEQN